MERINATSLRRKSGQWGTQPSLLVASYYNDVCLDLELPASSVRTTVRTPAPFW
jgi:hypothetical protein